MLAMSMRFFTTALARSPIFAVFMTSVNRFPRAVVSFFLLAAALFLFSSTAFADFRSDSRFLTFPAVREVYSYNDIASGAAIDGALGALGVKLALGTGALLTTKSLIESVINGTPLGVVGYEYNGSFYDLVDQSTIRIRDNVVTIDGVDYKDVWLPHDAAVKFRVNAFDFISYYNIISESSGTYASGVGSIGDVPLYSVNGQTVSPRFSIPGDGSYSSGPITYTLSSKQTSSNIIYNTVRFYRDGASFGSGGFNNTVSESLPILAQYVPVNVSFGLRVSTSNLNYGSAISYSLPDSLVDHTPFDFNWTSSVIPAESLPVEQGLRFRVPASYVAGIPSTLDPSLPDYSTYLQSLSEAIAQARLADSVESTAFEEYDAPAPPVPSTGTIAEEPYTSLDGSLNGIQDSLDNIDTNIGTVDESLDDIQVYAEDASDSLHSIDTNLSQSVADTAGIKGFIQQYLPGVHSLLSTISSSVSNIAGSIAAADSTFFGNVVDAIVAPFTPVFDIFKAGVGIWRYVVAWVGNISAPFSWIWSTLSRANGILVSPILASAAAAVVLAVYKRFGR